MSGFLVPVLCDFRKVSLLLQATISSLLKEGIVSQIPSSSDVLLPISLLSTAHVLAHPGHESCLKNARHLPIPRNIHSSNIIFLMWSSAVSLIPPAHSDWVT